MLYYKNFVFLLYIRSSSSLQRLDAEAFALWLEIRLARAVDQLSYPFQIECEFNSLFWIGCVVVVCVLFFFFSSSPLNYDDFTMQSQLLCGRRANKKWMCCIVHTKTQKKDKNREEKKNIHTPKYNQIENGKQRKTASN